MIKRIMKTIRRAAQVRGTGFAKDRSPNRTYKGGFLILLILLSLLQF